MAKKISETGDAVVIGSLRREIDLCIAFGPKYSPTNPLISILNLQHVLTAGETAYSNLLGLRSPARIAIIDRTDVFDPVSKLMTRVANATKASNVSNQFIKDVVNLVKKINGIRIVPKIKQTEDTPPEDIIHYISASQMGFDNRIAKIEELISLLGAEPHYTPNETDLTVTSLSALLVDLKAKHAAVSVANSQMVIARNTKNDILYRESSGAVELGSRVKKYVVSVYGGNSMEFHEVAKCKFRKKKI